MKKYIFIFCLLIIAAGILILETVQIAKLPLVTALKESGFIKIEKQSNRKPSQYTIIATGDVIPARSVNARVVRLNNFNYPFEKTVNTLKSFVIVAFHWGLEYTALPTSKQKELAHAAIDAGADLIIGNHPHWVQGNEGLTDMQFFPVVIDDYSQPRFATAGEAAKILSRMKQLSQQ